MCEILVVEDEYTERRELAGLMEELVPARHIRCAATCEGAIEMIEQLCPDLILLDIMLKGRSGFEVARYVRGRGLDCRIVILTAYSEFDFASKAMSMGIQDYLLKPIRPDLLLQRIQSVLSRPAGGAVQPPQLWPSLACGMTHALPQPLPQLPVRVVVALLAAPLSQAEGEALSRQAAPQCRLECYERQVVCYCPAGEGDPLEAARSLLAAWTPLLPGRCPLARAGVGLPAAGPGELAESYRTARLAAGDGSPCARPVCLYAAGPEEGSADGRADHPLVANTIAILESRYPEPLKLEGVAREQFVSPAYLGRIFHAHTGQSFRDYLTRVRLGHAARLLEGGSSVSAAAAAVGYEDPNYFSRVYKKQFGYPPSDGRK